jgi:tetratricopeptide (TPR) repeat protein
VTKATAASPEQALALYKDGDFERAHAQALELLETRPRDAALLRLAGKAAVELGRDDAVSFLEQAAEIDPDNPDVLHDLVDALLAEGRVAEATDVAKRIVELRPRDASALVDLAYALHASGRVEEGIAYLEQALELEFGNVAALRGLLGMYRERGRLEDALEAGRKVISYQPEDVLSAIDVAELMLTLDRTEEAVEAFRWVRDVDDEVDHEVYAYHGMIEAEIRRQRWRAALDLAVDATRVDRLGRTTDLLAYIVTQVFGAADRPTPSRRDVDDALVASREEHRRLHTALGV